MGQPARVPSSFQNPMDNLRDNILPVPTTDTSSAAQAVQLRIQRAMTGEQRLLMAFEMSLFARELAKEGIRREHPEWTSPCREGIAAVSIFSYTPSLLDSMSEAEVLR